MGVYLPMVPVGMTDARAKAKKAERMMENILIDKRMT